MNLDHDDSGRTKRPTLKDVAHVAGVDPSLVSRVLNNDDMARVSDETRARIVEAARLLDYRLNYVARSLRTSRTYTIGVAFPAVANPLFAELVDAVQVAAAGRGFAVVVSGTATSVAKEHSLVRLLHERRVDGLLVTTGGEMDDGTIRSVDAAGDPIVVVNTTIEGVRACATVDDRAAAEMVTDHLVSLGHQRLLHLAGPLRFETARRRLAGFNLAIERSGAAATYRELDNWDAQAGWAAGIEHLAASNATGVVVANSFAAIGVIAAARELGRRVPDDVSVVAIHEHPLARFVDPPITVAQLPMRELGAVAFDLLLQRIEGGPAGWVEVPTAPELIVRGSAAAPRSAT
jgi:LacI family transcriptional regulator